MRLLVLVLIGPEEGAVILPNGRRTPRPRERQIYQILLLLHCVNVRL